MMYTYQLIFTDALNQRSLGGKYGNFIIALLTARNAIRGGYKSKWQIVRLTDGVTVAESRG